MDVTEDLNTSKGSATKGQKQEKSETIIAEDVRENFTNPLKSSGVLSFEDTFESIEPCRILSYNTKQTSRTN